MGWRRDVERFQTLFIADKRMAKLNRNRTRLEQIRGADDSHYLWTLRLIDRHHHHPGVAADVDVRAGHGDASGAV